MHHTFFFGFKRLLHDAFMDYSCMKLSFLLYETVNCVRR